MMTSRIATATTLAAIVLIGSGIHAQKKPAPPSNYPCVATFRDAGTDALVSDGRGAYVNGTAGVTCVVVNPTTANTFGDLSLYVSGGGKPSTKRAIGFEETNGGVHPGYSSFLDAGGQLRVKNILAVTESGSSPLMAYGNSFHFRAGAPRVGDIYSNDEPELMPATVTRTGACTWTITHSTEVSVWEGSGWTTLRGVVMFPFEVDIEVTTGLVGC